MKLLIYTAVFFTELSVWVLKACKRYVPDGE